MKRNLVRFIATATLALSMVTSVFAAPQHTYNKSTQQMIATNYKFTKETKPKLIKGTVTEIRIVDGSWVLYIKTSPKQHLSYPVCRDDNGWMSYIKVGSKVEVRVDYGCDPLKRQAKVFKVQISKANYDKIENSATTPNWDNTIIGVQGANPAGLRLLQSHYDQAVNLGVCKVVRKVPGSVNTYIVDNSKSGPIVVDLDVKGVTYESGTKFGAHDHKLFYYEGTHKVDGIEYPYFVE